MQNRRFWVDPSIRGEVNSSPLSTRIELVGISTCLLAKGKAEPNVSGIKRVGTLWCTR